MRPVGFCGRHRLAGFASLAVIANLLAQLGWQGRGVRGFCCAGVCGICSLVAWLSFRIFDALGHTFVGSEELAAELTPSGSGRRKEALDLGRQLLVSRIVLFPRLTQGSVSMSCQCVSNGRVTRSVVRRERSWERTTWTRMSEMHFNSLNPFLSEFLETSPMLVVHYL